MAACLKACLRGKKVEITITLAVIRAHARRHAIRTLMQTTVCSLAPPPLRLEMKGGGARVIVMGDKGFSKR